VFVGKSTKTAATRAALLTPICTKSFDGWGFAPDPTGGAYSAPQDPLAVFRDLLLKGGDRRGRGEKGGEDRKERAGERRRGEEGGSSSFDL